ncbi:general secretory pathway protein K [Beggiatoa sp. PS]|nr:general secretory pathway protein K [Beggiatoa sp. PS]
MKKSTTQHGAILIIVLWFIVIIIVMVAALAGEIRLSAKIVLHNKIILDTWGDTLQALNAAQMELLINQMRDPIGEEEVPLEERREKAYRFNGQKLELAYSDYVPKTVTVRIYDHAGKIGLKGLLRNKNKLYQLLEKRIGKEPEKFDALYDAWTDWYDEDHLHSANGAEKDYYETQPIPYEPRNDRKLKIETVEELLLIKGFDEVFKGVEIDTVFTIYHDRTAVNPNLATREALMMIPGMNEEIATKILTERRKKDLKRSDIQEMIEPEDFAEIRSWLNFSTSNFYTIAIQVKNLEDIQNEDNQNEDFDTEESETPDEETSSKPQEYQRAYMITVQPKGYNKLPKILRVEPYGMLPDTRHENIPIEEVF